MSCFVNLISSKKPGLAPRAWPLALSPRRLTPRSSKPCRTALKSRCQKCQQRLTQAFTVRVFFQYCLLFIYFRRRHVKAVFFFYVEGGEVLDLVHALSEENNMPNLWENDDTKQVDPQKPWEKYNMLILLFVCNMGIIVFLYLLLLLFLFAVVWSPSINKVFFCCGFEFF